MKKFRVLSDLHLDINDKYPLKIKDKNTFTLICGDTSGYPDMSIKWIKQNCHNGIGISGNHLPYNDYNKTIQELREDLSKAFPIDNRFTYLDCETDVFNKEVDGILFVGTCMYSDMNISHPLWNPTGNKNINMRASMSHMNDYRWGILKKDYLENNIYIKAENYLNWFNNAFSKIDALLNDNESKKQPLPVVLITHYSLLPDFFNHNAYLEEAYSIRTYNWSSYASDYTQWLKKHNSIKCYCCGHIHAVDKHLRNFYITRDDNTKILIVNNARGYVNRGHDTNFNVNTFVDVEKWQVIQYPLSKNEQNKRKKRADDMIKQLAWFI